MKEFGRFRVACQIFGMPTVAWILDLTLLMAFENSSERVMVSGCFKNGMMGKENYPCQIFDLVGWRL
jgi:hypothetical protein